MCMPEKEKKRRKKERKTKKYTKKNQGNKYCNFCMGVKYLEESKRAAVCKAKRRVLEPNERTENLGSKTPSSSKKNPTSKRLSPESRLQTSKVLEYKLLVAIRKIEMRQVAHWMPRSYLPFIHQY